MTLHLYLDADTPADVQVEHLGGRSLFTPKTIAGARWLNTHCGGGFYKWSVAGVISHNTADLARHLRDSGLVVTGDTPR